MAVNATTDDGPITREKREFENLLLSCSISRYVDQNRALYRAESNRTTCKTAGLKELIHGCSQLRYQMAVNSYDRVMLVYTYPCPGIILTMS